MKDWSSANPDVRNFFLVLFLLSFMLTLPLHEVMTPLFFFFCFSSPFIYFFSFQMDPPLLFIFSPPFLSHLPFSPFLFCWFACFLTTASWNRSGWHPRSLTGQCTSHLQLPLLSFLRFSLPVLASSSTLSPLFLAFLQHYVLFHCSLNLISPRHIPLSPPSLTPSPSLSTHSFLFQTTISSNLNL